MWVLVVVWQVRLRTAISVYLYYTILYTHTRLTALCPGLPGWASTNLDFTEAKRRWVAVASAGPYASLHLAPDRYPYQHPTTQFLQTGCPSCRTTNYTIPNINIKYQLSGTIFFQTQCKYRVSLNASYTVNTLHRQNRFGTDINTHWRMCDKEYLFHRSLLCSLHGPRISVSWSAGKKSMKDLELQLGDSYAPGIREGLSEITRMPSERQNQTILAKAQ